SVLPAIVNVLELCNAFYVPDIDGQGTPGWAFGDENTCGFANADFALDSDVIYHEYTHGVVDWMGIGLIDSPTDSYTQAISEADADYHSANFTGDPVIGDALGFTRNLQNGAIYPDDVPCFENAFEAHCTSLIWSGLLWDVQSALKKKAERL